MKTAEYIKAVEEMGLSVHKRSNNMVIIKDYSENSVAWVNAERRWVLDTNFAGFSELDEAIRGKMFALAVEYSTTPLREREEEKRYRLKSTNFHNVYLMTEDGVRYPYQNEWYKGSVCQKVFFTEAELGVMDEFGFEREPVKEEDK